MMYERKQRWYIPLVLFLGASVAWRWSFELAMLCWALFVVAIIASFMLPGILIDSEAITLRYAFGLSKKRFPLQEIVSAKALPPAKGAMYAIFSKTFFRFHAVQLTLKDSQTWTVLTNEPEKVEQAIRSAKKA